MTEPALTRLFDRVVVINLPERADRRRGIDAELRKVGLSLEHPKVELFAAIRPAAAGGFPSIGAQGAFRSHLAVMERMVAQDWARVLVLEDDMAFSPGFAARLAGLVPVLQSRPWAMLYGHAGAAPPPADALGLIELPASINLIQLHFLGLGRAAATAAIPFLHAMLARPTGSPEGGPMHVDGALNWFRRAHPELTFLALDPPIAHQRASRSDIAEPRWFDRWPLLRNLTALARRLRTR